MKLPAWTARPLQIVLTSFCMAVIMSTVLTLAREGWVEGVPLTILRNALIAFRVALFAGSLVFPLVERIVKRVTLAPGESNSKN